MKEQECTLQDVENCELMIENASGDFARGRLIHHGHGQFSWEIEHDWDADSDETYLESSDEIFSCYGLCLQDLKRFIDDFISEASFEGREIEITVDNFPQEHEVAA